MTAAPTCIVLGARGFVGRAVVAEALRRGYQVTSVDQAEYEAARGARCDLLINANGNSRKYLAAQDPALEFDLSVRSVQRALHDFKAARHVHLSTCDVYNDHEHPAANAEEAATDPARLSPYGLHKQLAEQLVRYYAPDWLVLRMAGFVGAGLRKNSIYDLLTGAPLRVHPDSRYQYLNTRDLAAILFDLLDAGLNRATVNVAGDGLISLREVAAMLPPQRARELTAAGAPPLETYDINIARLQTLRPAPRTRDTVRAFVDDVLSGREVLVP